MRWRDIEKEKPELGQMCVRWRDKTGMGMTCYYPEYWHAVTHWFPVSEIPGPHAEDDALRPNWEIREACDAACTCGGDHNCDACMVWHRLFNAGAINAEMSVAQ